MIGRYIIYIIELIGITIFISYISSHIFIFLTQKIDVKSKFQFIFSELLILTHNLNLN